MQDKTVLGTRRRERQRARRKQARHNQHRLEAAAPQQPLPPGRVLHTVRAAPQVNAADTVTDNIMAPCMRSKYTSRNDPPLSDQCSVHNMPMHQAGTKFASPVRNEP